MSRSQMILNLNDIPPELLEYESYYYLPFQDIHKLRRTSSNWYRIYLQEMRRRADTQEPWLFSILIGDGELFADLIKSTNQIPFRTVDLLLRLLVTNNISMVVILLENIPNMSNDLVDLVYNRSMFSTEAFVRMLYSNDEVLYLVKDSLFLVDEFLLDVYNYLVERDGSFDIFYEYLVDIKDIVEYIPDGWVRTFLDYWIDDNITYEEKLEALCRDVWIDNLLDNKEIERLAKILGESLREVSE